ncbi:MAG: hypothetical protein HGA36_03815 [Candidatus Moranbacteria bacterium]|nr:hypothetical protein [Candidatus Moranbacteria bacterium]
MQKQIFKILFLLTIFFVVPNFVLAAPSVNAIAETLTHGNVLTVGGSDFGSKINIATPLVWDDFNVGNDGDLLSVHGWNVGTDNILSERPQLSSNKLRHVNTNNVAKFYFTRNPSYYAEDVAWRDELPVVGKKRYVDYWMWYEMPIQPMGQEAHQLKLVRMQSGPGESTDNVNFPTINTYAWRYNGGVRELYFPIYSNLTDSESIYTTPFLDGSWVHVKMWIDVGTENNNDGILKVWSNGSVLFDRADIKHIATGYGLKNWYDNFQIGKYLGNTPTQDVETTIYFSDVYYDTSWARVEIGDNQIYNNCSHTEIQIPSSWSDNAIDIRINAGSFATNANAYLFVIDADGNASAGQLITIDGATSDATPPSAPTGLGVN